MDIRSMMDAEFKELLETTQTGSEEEKAAALVRINEKLALIQKYKTGATTYSSEYFDVPVYSVRCLTCKECGCDLNWRDPVWRDNHQTFEERRHNYQTPPGGRYNCGRFVPALMCDKCGTARRANVDRDRLKSYKCQRCKRMVKYYQRPGHQLLLSKFCTDYCKNNQKYPPITGERECDYCLKPFKPKRNSAAFCSPKCRVASHRNPETRVENLAERERQAERDEAQRRAEIAERSEMLRQLIKELSGGLRAGDIL